MQPTTACATILTELIKSLGQVIELFVPFRHARRAKSTSIYEKKIINFLSVYRPIYGRYGQHRSKKKEKNLSGQ